MPSAPSSNAAPTERLEGVVHRITFRNEENAYAVIRLKPATAVHPKRLNQQGLITLVGTMPGIEIGQSIEGEGRWESDQRWGPQFRVDWFKPQLPKGCRGIEVYLASGAVKGIGPKTAERIVRRFGERTFDILDQEPERLSEVAGLGRKTTRKIIDSWRAHRGDRELITFLGEHGISPRVAAQLRKVYEERALSVVRANPYRLVADVRGIGFRRADQIARKIGMSPEAPERIDAALNHVLDEQSSEGHTCLPRERLETLAAELLEQPAERVTERLENLLANAQFAVESIGDVTFVFLRTLHESEQRAAWAMRQLLTSPTKRLPGVDAVAVLADFEQRTRFQLAEAQRQAVLRMAREGMMILTGGPGTGKTTTVRSILEVFEQARLRVKLAAPTGRAARRLSETTHRPAETIHRLLNFQAHLGKFARDAANPIEADLVIIDEVSMLDAPMAAFLLEAIPPRACVLLVGDEDQLPSVGPGNVLGDLIASDAIPLIRLTEIFRQAASSLIVTNAHRINRGLLPYLEPPPSAVAAGVEPDFFFIERTDPADVIDTIQTLALERIPSKFGLDPIRDIQVLTPMRRGDLGVEAINEVLQQTLNADPQKKDAEPGLFEHPPAGARARSYRPGDRVMQTSNNYDKNVFNGDIGHISFTDAESGEVHVHYEGRAVSYLADEVDQLTLAYATTIHKSQGSEYPAVIIPIHTQHWIMLQRNLIYTALTRARRLVCLVGTRKALRRAVTNAERAQRYTALRHFIQCMGTASARQEKPR